MHRGRELHLARIKNELCPCVRALACAGKDELTLSLSFLEYSFPRRAPKPFFPPSWQLFPFKSFFPSFAPLSWLGSVFWTFDDFCWPCFCSGQHNWISFSCFWVLQIKFKLCPVFDIDLYPYKTLWFTLLGTEVMHQMTFQIAFCFITTLVPIEVLTQLLSYTRI